MFVSGAYRASYQPNGTGPYFAVGQTEDSFELEFTFNGDPVRGDNMGDAVQDIIHRGGDCFLSMVLIEWDRALDARIFWPSSQNWFGQYDRDFIGSISATHGLTTTGRTAGRLILNKVMTSGVTYSTPAQIDIPYATLAPGFPVRTLLGPRLRRIPLRMQLLPFSSGTEEYRFFHVT